MDNYYHIKDYTVAMLRVLLVCAVGALWMWIFYKIVY